MRGGTPYLFEAKPTVLRRKQLDVTWMLEWKMKKLDVGVHPFGGSQALCIRRACMLPPSLLHIRSLNTAGAMAAVMIRGFSWIAGERVADKHGNFRVAELALSSDVFDCENLLTVSGSVVNNSTKHALPGVNVKEEVRISAGRKSTVFNTNGCRKSIGTIKPGETKNFSAAMGAGWLSWIPLEEQQNATNGTYSRCC